MNQNSRWLLFGVVFAAGLAACSPAETEASTTTSPSTITSPTTTSPADTTSTLADTTTTLPTTTTTTPPTTTTTIDTNQLADGSGCTPGTDTLPDGTWYGWVYSISDTTLSFDLACWFTGDAAVIASAEDGEESPPPNDYYVRNENPKIRELDVAPYVPVLFYPDGDPTTAYETIFAEWDDLSSARGFDFGIWVTIEGGEVTSIDEQWVP